MNKDITKLEHDISERLVQDVDKASLAGPVEELYRAIARYKDFTEAMANRKAAVTK